HHSTIRGICTILTSVFEQKPLLHKVRIDNNLRELVSGGALLSNMSYAAFSFHQLLHLIGSPTSCAITLELTLFNVMFQEYFGAKSVRDFRKPIIAHAVLDVVIVPINISHREERIV